MSAQVLERRLVDVELLQLVLSEIADAQVSRFGAFAGQRGELLEWIAFTLFDSRAYSEREMNAILTSIHDDFASLRRYLVDEGYFDRDASGTEYRRAEDSALRRWMFTSANADSARSG